MRLNPAGQTWIASLPEKEAVGIQWERLWGPDSNTSPGTESLRNLDQSLPLFGTQFSHLQNEGGWVLRGNILLATTALVSLQPERQGQENGGVEILTPKVLGKPGSGWDGQREPAQGAVPTILSAAGNAGLPGHLPQAAGQDVSIVDSQQQTSTTLCHGHFHIHTCFLHSSDPTDVCSVTAAPRVCQGWGAK